MKMVAKRITYTFLVTMIVVFSTSFAVLMTLERTDYRNYLQGEYSKNMYELITAVQNIGVDLGKAEVTGSKDQKIITFEEIFRYSSIASDKLHSLPLPQETINLTSKFLSQTGDFCYSQVKATSSGKELTDGEYTSIDNLKSQSSNLLNRLSSISQDMGTGKINWSEIRKKVVGILSKGTENAISDKFENIQKQIAQYPVLIYDGPFSDNVLNIKPRVSKLPEVTQKQSDDVIMKALGDSKNYTITKTNSKDKYGLKIYSYSIQPKDKKQKNKSIYADVTKNGGKIVYLINNRDISSGKLTKEAAIRKGSDYLESLGYKNMISMYSLKYDNTLVVNYVYKQGNVIVYPDQIKLKIALDNGQIIGVESEKYLFSHIENRKIETAAISQETAAKDINKKVKINSVNMVIIPTETDKEILCYEFSCTHNDDRFFIYINAKNGYEEKILQLFNTPNGELTM